MIFILYFELISGPGRKGGGVSAHDNTHQDRQSFREPAMPRISLK